MSVVRKEDLLGRMVEIMDIGKSGKYIFDHVKIRDTGSLLPVVFDIDVGYRRGGLVKSDEGENIALIAVSNIKADEPAMDYKLREDEKTTSICGLIIHSKKEAEVLSEFFKYIADNIEEQEAVNEMVKPTKCPCGELFDAKDSSFCPKCGCAYGELSGRYTNIGR